MSASNTNEVLLSPEDVVMLQEVAREGEGPEDTLSRVLGECRGEWMKKGRVAGGGDERSLLRYMTRMAWIAANCWKDKEKADGWHCSTMMVAQIKLFSYYYLGMELNDPKDRKEESE